MINNAPSNLDACTELDSYWKSVMDFVRPALAAGECLLGTSPLSECFPMRMVKLDGKRKAFFGKARNPSGLKSFLVVALYVTLTQIIQYSFVYAGGVDDWFVQKVCVDSNGKVVMVDPYYCPTGDTLRPLRVGEALPYYRHDQPNPPDLPNGYQRSDSYPILDPMGNKLFINSRIWIDPRSNQIQHLPDYDVNLIRDGWTSVGETRDDGGFGQTFFGGNRRPYNGWVFFPTNIFGNRGTPASGSVYMPIAGTSWEQDGVTAPGECPPHVSTDTLTSWRFVPKFVFSGIGGSPIKYLDTIISTHGYENSSGFLARGHLEVFYFTRLYGETRWEAWRPIAQGIKTKYGRCSGPTVMAYKGVQFNLTDCRDWSAITVTSAPSLPPILPLPDTNLLQNWHFDDGSMAPWSRTGGSIAWDMRQSVAPLDITHSKSLEAGVRYLAIQSSGNASDAQQVYQDIPIVRFKDHASYVFGATIRSESGLGTLNMELAQVDRVGNVIVGTVNSFVSSAGENMPSRARDGGMHTGADSIPLSSQFFSKSTVIEINPAATFVRFALSPQTPNVFDITDTWVIIR